MVSSLVQKAPKGDGHSEVDKTEAAVYVVSLAGAEGAERRWRSGEIRSVLLRRRQRPG